MDTLGAALGLPDWKVRVAVQRCDLSLPIASKQQLNTIGDYLVTNMDQPDYWDPFPEGQTHLEVELIGAAAGTEHAVERDRVLQRFQAQGAPAPAVSLKRIQDIPFWQRYAAQREHLRLKRGNANERGGPDTGCDHLYHGAKQNVQAVIATGPMARFSVQAGGHQGTWTHEQASYSCGSFAPTRQVFACRGAVGTPGGDRSFDCFTNGAGVFVFWVDSSIYTEYLIQW